MSELKPCPFCGGNAYECDYTHPNGGDWYFVKCDVCDAKSDEYHTQEVANNKWNTRPIEDALRAEVEQLKADNSRMREVLDEIINAYDGIIKKAKQALKGEG